MHVCARPASVRRAVRSTGRATDRATRRSGFNFYMPYTVNSTPGPTLATSVTSIISGSSARLLVSSNSMTQVATVMRMQPPATHQRATSQPNHSVTAKGLHLLESGTLGSQLHFRDARIGAHDLLLC